MSASKAFNAAYDGLVEVSDAEYDIVRQLNKPFQN